MKKVALALVFVFMFSVNAFAARALDAGIGFEMGSKVVSGPKGLKGSGKDFNLIFKLDDETAVAYINEEGKLSAKDGVLVENIDYNINAIKVSKTFGSTTVGIKLGSIETDATAVAGDQLNAYTGIDVSYSLIESKGKKINTNLKAELAYDIINMDNWTATTLKDIDTLNMFKIGISASINF